MADAKPPHVNALLADDNLVTRTLLSETLRRLGHDVTAVEDGAAALAAFQARGTQVLILDWMMPGMDGLEVCRRIRTLPGGGEVFILMVTAREGTTAVSEALAAGVDDYLVKPVTPELLAARITIAARRLEQDAARRQAETALAESQRLAGIGQTALALQHEINNPLTALLASAQLMAEEAPDESALRRELDEIVALARRIADVVRRLTANHDGTSVQYLRAARMLDLSPRNEQ